MANLKYFNGTVVLGLNGDKNNHNRVAVWKKGAVLNDINPRQHVWPDWDWNETPKEKVVRHHFIGEFNTMTKNELKKSMGINNLKSTQKGHRIYKDTNIGNVLYMTFDTNNKNMDEAMRIGFVDKKCQIHVNESDI